MPIELLHTAYACREDFYPRITRIFGIFCGGWYFENGPFTLPMHGNTFQTTQNGYGKTAAYRFFLQDATPFKTHLKVGIEHGGTNDADEDVWSLAFYYQQQTLSEIVDNIHNKG